MLFDEDIKFLYYFGAMHRGLRSQAVKDFDEEPEIKVLVSFQRLTCQLTG